MIFACSMLRLIILLYVFKFVLILACASVFVGVCFMFAYILSRNVIDLIIPPVIHCDFCVFMFIGVRVGGGGGGGS